MLNVILKFIEVALKVAMRFLDNPTNPMADTVRRQRERLVKRQDYMKHLIETGQHEKLSKALTDTIIDIDIYRRLRKKDPK